MTKFLIKPASVRQILCFMAFVFIVANAFYFIHNAGLRRFVTIERKTLGGVILIDQTKHPTPYVIERVRVGYTISGPLEYLLLSSGEEQQSFASALINVALSISIGYLLLKIDLADPYHWDNFGRAYLVYRIFIAAVLFNWATNWYSQCWITEHLQGPNNQYYYNVGTSFPFTCFTVILITAMLTLFGSAIRSKEELSLTI